MSTAVIVDAVRTPGGKRNGKLRNWHAVDLASEALRALQARNQIDPEIIDDVIMGCVMQVAEQSLNIGRNAVLAAGWPESVPATTIDRQCGSSQQALHFAAQGVMAGAYDVVVAAGVESMTRTPMGSSVVRDLGYPFGPRMMARYAEKGGLVGQGIGAEMIADQWGISRDDLDAFSAQSHQRAARATAEGRFENELVPVAIRDDEGKDTDERITTDEGIRPDSTVETLAKLKPAFKPEGGKVTAGNSSQITDGASAVLIMSEEKASALGLRPRARFHAFALAAAVRTRPDDRLRAGTRAYRRANLALFAAGLATFALLYSTQALLPALSSGLRLSPAQASLTVSAATGALALGLLPVSALSEKYGRTTVMTASVFGASLLALAVPFAPDLGVLVALRAAQGVALAGLPATAMAYLAEEVHPSAVPSAIGLYVAGNSIGGMSSRVAGGALAQAYGWRAALLVVGLTALGCAAAFRLLAPPARHFTPGPVHPAALWRTVGGHLRDVRLRRLYTVGMLFMAVFGAVYTVLGYRLTAAPYGLSQTAVGAVFLVYLVGTGTSAASGRLTAHAGRRGAFTAALVLCAAGLLLTLARPLPVVLTGLVLVTGGFFIGHAVASGAVSRTATTGRAQASALYLTAYYVGNSVGGTLGAAAYHLAGWGAAAALALGALVLAAPAALARPDTPPS